MQLLDQTVGTNFFLPPAGWTVGQLRRRSSAAARPLLWQHLFWFYSHPAVYIMILPAMGMVSDIIATFSRKPLFGYKPMVFAIAGHRRAGLHRLGPPHVPVGHEPAPRHRRSCSSTMMIALPSAIKVFNWLGTMWGGQHPVHDGDAQRHGVRGDVHHRRPVGHLHGGHAGRHVHPRHLLHRRPTSTTCSSAAASFGIFAAIYYWFPKMFGRMMNETLGQGPLLPDVHLLQRHVLPDAHHRHARPSRGAIADPTIYARSCEHAAAAEPVHDASAPSCWGWRSSSSW